MVYKSIRWPSYGHFNIECMPKTTYYVFVFLKKNAYNNAKKKLWLKKQFSHILVNDILQGVLNILI